MLVSREGSIFRWAPLIDRCTVVVSIHRCSVYLPVNCIPVVGQHLLGHVKLFRKPRVVAVDPESDRVRAQESVLGERHVDRHEVKVHFGLHGSQWLTTATAGSPGGVWSRYDRHPSTDTHDRASMGTLHRIE